MKTVHITDVNDLDVGDVARFRWDVSEVSGRVLDIQTRWGIPKINILSGTGPDPIELWLPRNTFVSATREVADDKFKPGDRVSWTFGTRKAWQNVEVVGRNDLEYAYPPAEAYDVKESSGATGLIRASELELVPAYVFKPGDKVEIRKGAMTFYGRVFHEAETGTVVLPNNAVGSNESRAKATGYSVLVRPLDSRGPVFVRPEDLTLVSEPPDRAYVFDLSGLRKDDVVVESMQDTPDGNHVVVKRPAPAEPKFKVGDGVEDAVTRRKGTVSRTVGSDLVDVDWASGDHAMTTPNNLRKVSELVDIRFASLLKAGDVVEADADPDRLIVRRKVTDK